MSKNISRGIVSIIPCILLLLGWFVWSYASVNEDSMAGIFRTNIVYEYHDTIRGVPSILSLSNDYNYFEKVEVIESEDLELKEESESSLDVQLLSYKTNVADLNNWIVPVVGNYVITTYYGEYHKAIDYYSYAGYNSDILASNNGTVYAAYNNCIAGDASCNGRRGNYVIINHNNGDYYTMYMHLNYVYVGVGTDVSAGDVIGSMGNTGYVIPSPSSSNPYGGTHLHYEVYIGIPDRGGYKINPLNLY